MSAEHCGGSASCHCGASSTAVAVGDRRVALAGAPNSGKTSIYNALTGLRAKTGNYPGVTVARSQGRCVVDGTSLTIEDLPGAYSLEPISPDEQVVRDVLTGDCREVSTPDALIVVVDATTLRRGMTFVAEALSLGLPTCLAVTMTDELARREGRLDVAALGEALGVPAVRVLGHRGMGIPELRQHLAEVATWPRTPLTPPSSPPGPTRSWRRPTTPPPPRTQRPPRSTASCCTRWPGPSCSSRSCTSSSSRSSPGRAPSRTRSRTASAPWGSSSTGGWTSPTRSWVGCWPTASSAASARCSSSCRRSSSCSSSSRSWRAWGTCPGPPSSWTG